MLLWIRKTLFDTYMLELRFWPFRNVWIVTLFINYFTWPRRTLWPLLHGNARVKSYLTNVVNFLLIGWWHGVIRTRKPLALSRVSRVLLSNVEITCLTNQIEVLHTSSIGVNPDTPTRLCLLGTRVSTGVPCKNGLCDTSCLGMILAIDYNTVWNRIYILLVYPYCADILVNCTFYDERIEQVFCKRNWWGPIVKKFLKYFFFLHFLSRSDKAENTKSEFH